ncbi:MAG: hypothetical protein KBT28_03495 [Bacteroidales bacterium]|nr:hypothetical protein [Candidatus Colimorpha merdihippi]
MSRWWGVRPTCSAKPYFISISATCQAYSIPKAVGLPSAQMSRDEGKLGFGMRLRAAVRGRSFAAQGILGGLQGVAPGGGEQGDICGGEGLLDGVHSIVLLGGGGDGLPVVGDGGNERGG